ncbi:hypothetical protein [Clostridium sp. D33t1_170424_F3]|uniref:hypothetical protein n=1 Tax=Clostridium sp. D33t1_170424_F3 TaxID=2787099 RepID=UPI0018A8FC29|nr:hypothetical protein [Clostridium sp. D33t1_170424_F3]
MKKLLSFGLALVLSVGLSIQTFAAGVKQPEVIIVQASPSKISGYERGNARTAADRHAYCYDRVGVNNFQSKDSAWASTELVPVDLSFVITWDIRHNIQLWDSIIGVQAESTTTSWQTDYKYTETMYMSLPNKAGALGNFNIWDDNGVLIQQEVVKAGSFF